MQKGSKYKEVRSKEGGSVETIVEDDISSSKLCIMFIILCLLGVMCLANLLALAFMYYTLEIQGDGLRSVSFFKQQSHIKWILDADFETMVVPHGVISGFSDANVDLVGDTQDLNLTADMSSILSMTSSGTYFKSSNFKFVDPRTKKGILDFNADSKLSIVGEFGGKSLSTNALKTHRISSDNFKDLTFRSNKSNLVLIGNEGVLGDVKNMDVVANDDVWLNVDQNINDLIFDGGNRGIRMNPSRLPNTKSSDQVVQSPERYRLCLCKRTGLLFRSKIQNGVTCAIAKEDPCLLG